MSQQRGPLDGTCHPQEVRSKTANAQGMQAFLEQYEMDIQSIPSRQGVTLGICMINRLLLVADLVLFASYEQGLQHVIVPFSAP